MDEKALLEYMKNGNTVKAGSDVHKLMHGLSRRAIEITCRLNNAYHEPQELRKIFSELIGREVDKDFGLFPPFYADCGLNITIGKKERPFNTSSAIAAGVCLTFNIIT